MSSPVLSNRGSISAGDGLSAPLLDDIDNVSEDGGEFQKTLQSDVSDAEVYNMLVDLQATGNELYKGKQYYHSITTIILTIRTHTNNNLLHALSSICVLAYC